jgi:hypothetical protein
MSKKSNSLYRFAAGLLAGFGIQFLAGMFLNLFVTIPRKHPGTMGNDYFIQSSHSLIWILFGSGGVALAIHVYIAIALFLGCLGLFILSLKLHDLVWARMGGIACLFTLGALFNGLSFIDYNKDISSMIMASFWLIAVGALIVGLLSRTHRTI